MTKKMKNAGQRLSVSNEATLQTLANQNASESSLTIVPVITIDATDTELVADLAKPDDLPSAAAAKDDARVATEPNSSKPKTTKQELVLTLLSQPSGTTIDEIMQATDWQQHSVRGFLAGTVRKKLGFDLTSVKEDGEERRYAIKVAG